MWLLGWIVVLGIILLIVAVSCGSGVSSDESVAGVLEHFCRYEAASEGIQEQCFSEGISSGAEKLLSREEWGPKAQAVLYAIGELKDCGSKSGPRCEPGDWPPVLENDVLLVDRYCAYGSESWAQYAGCYSHVRRQTVLAYANRSYPTNASSYAVGVSTDCGYDSGPFCR
ncbi:MAG TPA: hypothetical protein VHI77_08345 [Solirubrobacterales bacterium]|jgi:hypothetical protein|nr:hypothetical protein [Solirubrobacterales bacterium]